MSTNVVLNGTTYAIPAEGDSGWGTVLSNFFISIGSNVLQKTGGTFTLTADVDFGATYGVKSAYIKSRGTNPSSAGILRLANAEAVSWRNAANAADLALSVNSSDQLTYNGNVLASTTGPSFQDSIFKVFDNSDITKILQFQLSGITTGTTRTLTIPDANDTIVGKATTDTFTNKTFDADGTGNSISNIENADIKAAAAIAVNKLAAVTASRALASDASGFISATSVTDTELGYVSGVTSAIQTQFTAKAPLISPSFTTPNIGAATGTSLSVSGQLTSTVSTGTAPLVVSSTTEVANLKAATATAATNVGITDDTTTNATMYPTWVTANTGNLPQKVTSTKLTYNPSTGSLATTTFVGALTGTASGNTTYTANQYGVVLSGSANTMAVLAPDASTTKVLTSGGASANPSWATVSSLNNLSVSAVKTTTYSILTTDEVVLVDGTSAFTATLPTAVGVTGKMYRIKRVDQTLANAVTIATTSSQTIDGVTTRKLMTQYEEFTVVSDNANWQVVSHTYPSLWVAYTPTITNMTVTGTTGFWRREGDSAHIRVFTDPNGAASGIINASIPTGLTIATAKTAGGTAGVGNSYGFAWCQPLSGANYGGGVTYDSSTTVRVIDTTTSSGDYWRIAVPATWAAGGIAFNLDFVVPITNWEG